MSSYKIQDAPTSKFYLSRSARSTLLIQSAGNKRVRGAPSDYQSHHNDAAVPRRISTAGQWSTSDIVPEKWALVCQVTEFALQPPVNASALTKRNLLPVKSLAI